MKVVPILKMLNASDQICKSFKVMSNPDRLMIVLFLSKGEKCVGEIEVSLNIPQPTLSQQLTVLRKENFVNAKRKGKNVFYELKSSWILPIINMVYDQTGKKY
jgi:DNA-binding transcriptional ArsR family regulator